MTKVTVKTKKVSKQAIIKEWQDFYLKYFGLTIDLSGVKIPRLRKGYDRVIIIAQGLTCNETLEALRKLFNVYTSYVNDDLGKAISSNSRDTTSSYAIRVKDSIEPDQEYFGKSADEADPQGNLGVTLLERLVLELKYFVETDQHLDVEGRTLCTGSRVFAGAAVPDVDWNPHYRRLGVDYDSFVCVFARRGLRSVVL